jgi:hypothetical protein
MAMDVLSDGDGRLEDGMTVMRRQWSNATAMDGAKVMDVPMATAMDGLLATRRWWTGNGDQCRNCDGDGWLIGTATVMDGLLAAWRWWTSQQRRRWTACHQRKGDGQVTVIDVMMAMAMNGVLATWWQWMDRWQHNGDGRLENNVTVTWRQWSNATKMDGATVMDDVMGDGNGQLVGWWWNAWGRRDGDAMAREQRNSNGWREGDGHRNGDSNGWLVGNATVMDGQWWWVSWRRWWRQWMAYWQRDGNEWIVGGVTVMEGLRTARWRCDCDGATRRRWMAQRWWKLWWATAMDGLSDGDGRLENGARATQLWWSNAMVVDGTTVMDVATATAMDGKWTACGQCDGDGWIVGGNN